MEDSHASFVLGFSESGSEEEQRDGRCEECRRNSSLSLSLSSPSPAPSFICEKIKSLCVVQTGMLFKPHTK